MKIDQEGKRATEVMVCRNDAGRMLTAGDELFAINFWTDRMLFCVSQIPPGRRTPLDPGHKDADEAMYVVKGTLVVEFPNIKRCEKLSVGDSILVPQDEPHIMFNPGDEITVTVVATAPNLGFDMSELTG
jgi:mannose-6-phosphate isomerase-like protein (cupin superfamily)